MNKFANNKHMSLSELARPTVSLPELTSSILRQSSTYLWITLEFVSQIRVMTVSNVEGSVG